jgi:hypothetical protein
MFALRSRPWAPWALSVRQSEPRRPFPSAIRLSPPASETPLQAQTLPSSVPCNSPAKSDRHHATSSSQRRALFPRSFAQEQKPTPLPSRKSAPLPPGQNLQLICLPSLADSLRAANILTPTFPSPCGLFLRSWASVKLSTPLVSTAYALFEKTTREGVHPSKPNPRPVSEFRGCYSRNSKESEGLRTQP